MTDLDDTIKAAKHYVENPHSGYITMEFARALLHLHSRLESAERENRKYRAALFRIWSPDYVMKNDAMWAYKILNGRRDLARSVLGDDRMKFETMDEEILAWKDPK